MLQVLHPIRYTSLHENSPDADLNKKPQRFSTLLLDHGEQELQDWGVIASSRRKTSSKTNQGASNVSSSSLRSLKDERNYSEASNSITRNKSLPSMSLKKKQSSSKGERDPSTNMKSIRGRLHLCSKSIVFEPEDVLRGIIRIPFEKMTISSKKSIGSGFSSATLDTHAYTSGGSMSFSQNSSESFSERTVTLQTKRYTVMKKNNKIAPYETYDKRVSFTFTFQHSSNQSFLELFEKIYNLSQEQLEDVIKPMCDRPFDPSNLVHLNEVPQTVNLRAFALGPFPLVKKAGCVIVTDQRLYFQPFNGVYSEMAAKATSWCLDEVVAFARRYHGLKDEALEIFFQRGPSVLLAFEGYRNREEVLRLLPTSRNVQGMTIPVLCHTDRSFLQLVVDAWRSGTIDNFDYLLALNSAGGRSLLDLSRYPVFPWVLSDYENDQLDLSSALTADSLDRESCFKIFRDLTKPIGALNKERLENFKARWKNMQEDMGHAFLYGTHYSAPGYCLYYLVRTMPEQMLCLQNGKYDAPDRLFHSIEQCFSSLLINPADLKESIPQFYDPKSGVDILLNLRGLQLGVTQTGIIIDDVKLPKWAKSPKEFLKMNRKALESEYCTALLPSWIDLIFGIKSRGELAFKSDNLFHPTAYLSPKDLDEMETESEKMQAELQATEFGICPDVLFSGQHPTKNDNNIPTSAFIASNNERSLVFHDKDIGARISSQSEENNKMFDNVQPTQQATAAGVDIVQRSSETVNTDEVTHDTMIEIDPSDFRNDDETSVNTSTRNILLSGSGVSTKNTNIIKQNTKEIEPDDSRVSSPSSDKPQDGNMMENGWRLKSIARKEIHGGEVSGCHLSAGEPGSITTTSLDGGLMVHLLPSSRTTERRTFSSNGRNPSPMETDPDSNDQLQFHTFRSHQSSDPLSCLHVISDGIGSSIAFAGGHDDVIIAYGINSACGLASVYAHRDTVTGLVLVQVPFVSDGLSTHIMISSSSDATVKLWKVTVSDGETVRIGKEPFVELYEAESPIDCVDAVYIPEVGLMIAAGGSGGSLIVWLWTVDGGKTILYQEYMKPGKDPCSCLKWSKNGEIILFAGFQNGRISSFSFKHDGMYPVSTLSLGSAITCLQMLPFCPFVFMGCADGGFRILPFATVGHFDDANPIVWNSVNGPSSPGITSLSVIPSEGRENGYTISTGASDGSVAVFSIEKML